MRRKAGLLHSVIIISLLLIISCATTTLISVWKDDSFRERPSKVFIIGVSQKPTVRIIFENEFARQLNSYGVDAVPSHKMLTYEEMFDKETIVSKIKDLGMDSVLVTRAVAKKTIESSKQNYEKDWYDDFITSYNTYGYTYSNKNVHLETGLYSVNTEKLVWSVLTKMFVIEGTKKEKKIKSFIEVIMKKMYEDGLLK